MTLKSLSQCGTSVPQKRFKTAPLPFTGQKRQFINHFEKLLLDNIPNEGQGWTIIDVFGGSGLLAHNAKHILPKATVIYNDFDGYVQRLKAIPTTNALRQALYAFLKDEPRSLKLATPAKQKVFDTIKEFAHQGHFIDVQTIAGWLLFSGRQVGSLDEFLSESTLYNRIVKADYKTADGYLDGLIITKDSFDVLLSKYQDTPNCLLILDPPYLCTTQRAYALHEKGGYFGMTKFLQLMHFVRPPYVFFSSTRSELLNYMDYLQTYEPQKWQVLGGFTHIQVNAAVNKRISYEDNILAKF